MIKKQFTLYLENRPGMLAKVTRLLAANKVNIEGISVSASTDIGLVQIVVDNAAVTRKSLAAADISFTVQDVALVLLPHTPGALARLLGHVAKTCGNINYVYATGCDCRRGCHCYAIVSAPDIKKVEKAWKKLS
jgi:hypothetical protein